MQKTALLPVSLISVVTLTLGLTACATTGGLKPEQCATTDWQAMGYQDGLLGRDAGFIQQYANRCAKAGVQPNQTLWETGRQNGLKRYCTPLRAYQLGREGINFNNVCPPEQMIDLLKAHDEGYINYQREQALQQLWYDADPFFGDPWGGWGSPFYGRYGRGYGHFGGWMRMPIAMPHTLPQYIDEGQRQASPTTSNPSSNQTPITSSVEVKPATQHTRMPPKAKLTH